MDNGRGGRMRSPEMIAEVAVGRGPTGVAVTPDERFGYVTNAAAGTVSVVDLGTMTQVTTIDLPPATIGGQEFCIPNAIAVAPDGGRTYVAGTLAGGLRSIDPVTQTLTNEEFTGRFALGFPEGLAVSADGSTAYLSDSGLLGVRLVDLASRTASDTLINTDDSAPLQLAATSDGRFLFALTSGCTVVSVELAGPTILRPRVVINCEPVGIVATPDGGRLLVANFRGILADEDDSTITVIDVATRTLIGREIPLGFAGGPRATSIALSSDGATLYLTRTDRQTGAGTPATLPTAAVLDPPA